MSRKELIEQRIQQDLRPTVMQVVDESHQHASGKGAESHFNVTVVSEGFEGQLRVARHRRIHALLVDQMDEGLHALTLSLFTPAEYEARSSQAIASPKCSGSTTA